MQLKCIRKEFMALHHCDNVTLIIIDVHEINFNESAARFSYHMEMKGGQWLGYKLIYITHELWFVVNGPQTTTVKHHQHHFFSSSPAVQLLKSTDLSRHNLLYLKEIGNGWFGKVSPLQFHLNLHNYLLQHP